MSDSREHPTRPIVGVGVVVRKENFLLLVRRGQEPGRGMWSLPGGGLDLGECLQDAALREVREECGVEVKLGEVIETFDLILRDDAGRVQYHYVIVDFSANYLRGDLCAASDVVDARWVAASELGQYALADKTREVIGEVLKKGGDGR